jgi:hypothetical protein
MPPGVNPGGIEFDCGDSHYNDWLLSKAHLAVKSGSASVYLLVTSAHDGESEDDLGHVVGYFSISPTQVARIELPNKISGGVMNRAPGYLIGKLALDKSLQGRRPPEIQMGPQLVLAAVAKVVEAANVGGGQIIVVDADNEKLVPFYENCGFHSTGIDGASRLYMKISTARKILTK